MISFLNHCAIKHYLHKTTSNMTRHVLSLIEMVWINDMEIKKEISLTFQIFFLDRNEVTLRLNGTFCLSLLLLKLDS